MMDYYHSTDAHNTILVDGKGQDPHVGRIGRFFGSDLYIYVKGNAEESYEDLKEFSRHLVFIKPDFFIIYDKLQLTEGQHAYSWVLHTEAKSIEWGGNVVTAYGEKYNGEIRLLFPSEYDVKVKWGYRDDGRTRGKSPYLLINTIEPKGEEELIAVGRVYRNTYGRA